MNHIDTQELLNQLHARVDARIAQTFPSALERFKHMTPAERDLQEYLRAELRDHAAAVRS